MGAKKEKHEEGRKKKTMKRSEKWNKRNSEGK